MAQEIEIKLRGQAHGELRQRLTELGAGCQRRVRELNVFLDRPDGSMFAGGEGLRVRSETNRDTGVAEHVITHKGPRQAGRVKSRRETELRVEDSERACELLEVLGFVVTLSFEKDRDRWVLDGCHVELDTMPLLGTFVEIEGPDEDAVLSVQRRLGLHEAEAVAGSYAELLRDEQQRRGLDPRETVRLPEAQGS